jgi:DNA repair ATPase RecN
MIHETITIQDVGPITEHTLPLEPGVTVLYGGNEAGKTTAINATAALAGRDVHLEIRDGAKRGMVKGLGTTLFVGGKKNTRTGDLDAEAVEDKIDLTTLVAPGMKDAAANTRRRIKALLSLTATQLSLDDFRAVLPAGTADEILAADADEDPVDMAGKVKRRMETKAREWEAKAKDLEVQLQAQAQAYAGLDLTKPHDAEQLQAALTLAIRINETLKAEAASAKSDAERRA